MIFTKNNSIKEVMDYPQMKIYMPIFFPMMFINMIPKEMEKLSLSEIQDKIVMPWGVKFISDELVQAANIVVSIVEKREYTFFPLWESEYENYSPKISDITNKDSVCIYKINTNESDKKKRPSVIICPGGGYELLSADTEGVQIAKRMKEYGYEAFVLNYRVKPNTYPEPQKDLVLAIKYVRANAEKYGVDPDNIMIMGSSAGGHLCASTAALYDEISEKVMNDLEETQPELADKYRNISAKPNKICLNYPVISFEKEAHEGSFQALTGSSEQLRKKLSVENLVDHNYPKTFVWACEDDDLVPVSNSKRMGEALEANDIEKKVCIYPTGGHGCGLAYGTSAEDWIDEMITFMGDK